MKDWMPHLIAGLCGITSALSAATLSYVVSIEHRLTTLEVKDLLRSRGMPPPTPSPKRTVT